MVDNCDYNYISSYFSCPSYNGIFSSIPCSTSKEESIWKIFFMSLLLLLYPVASSVKWIFFSLLLCASLGCTIFLKYAHLPYFLICSHSIPFYVSEKMSGKCTIYIQIRSRHARRETPSKLWRTQCVKKLDIVQV